MCEKTHVGIVLALYFGIAFVNYITKTDILGIRLARHFGIALVNSVAQKCTSWAHLSSIVNFVTRKIACFALVLHSFLVLLSSSLVHGPERMSFVWAPYCSACFQVLDVRLNMLGERHPKVALTVKNLGYLRRLMGEPNRALKYYEKVRTQLPAVGDLLWQVVSGTCIHGRVLGSAVEDMAWRQCVVAFFMCTSPPPTVE